MLFQVYKDIINNAHSVLESRSDELESIVNDFIEETVLEFRENITQLAANNNLTDEDIQIIIAGCRTSDEYKDHCEKQLKNMEKFLTMDNKRKHAKDVIEIWRTVQANRRQGNVS